MINLRKRLFSVESIYPNPIERQRAQGLLIINAVVFIAALLSMVMTALTYGFFVPGDDTVYILIQIQVLVVPVLCLIIHWSVRRRWLNLGMILFILMQVAAIGTFLSAGPYTSNTLLLAIPLISAISLLGRRGLITIFGLLLIFAIIGSMAQSRLAPTFALYPADRWQMDMFLTVTGLVLSMVLLYLFSGLTQNLAEEAQTEVDQLRKVAQFAANIDVKDEEALFVEIVNFTRTSLKYPFAQIFYVGDDGVLNRRLRSSLGINIAVEKVNDSTVADGSGIKQAANELKPVLLSMDDAPLRWRHFLPSTTHGIALPIFYQDTLLGVLDVQKDNNQPFSEAERETLEALTRTLGATAVRIRLLGALRENIQQHEDVTSNLRTRLQELRLSPAAASGGATWAQYMLQRGENVFGFDLDPETGKLTESRALTPALETVLQTGALQITSDDEHKTIHLPISLRGEVMGAMTFSIPKARVLSDRQLETAQIITNRLALALENKRLFEQSQAVAARERKANEATNLLISATNVEAVMNVAAASFNDALGAINTRIHLQPSLIDDTEPKEEPVV